MKLLREFRKNKMAKYLFRFLILLSFMLLACSVGFFILLPHYIHTSLFPRLVQKTGIVQFQSTRPLLGLHSADIGFVVGSPDKPVLSVASLSIHYSLADLFLSKVEEISIRGVEINCALKNNAFIVDEPALQELLTGAEPQKPAKGLKKSTLPITVKRISISQATLLFTMNDKLFRIPFDAQFLYPDRSSPPASLPEVNINLFLLDQKITVSGLFDENLEKLDLSMAAENFNLLPLSDLIDLPQDLKISSPFTIKAEAKINLSPFLVTDFAGTFDFGNSMVIGEFVLSPQATPPQNNLPLVVNFEGLADNQVWNFKAATSFPALRAEYAGKTLDILSPSVQLSGNYAAGNATFDTITRLGLEMADNTFQASVPVMTIQSRGTILKEQKIKIESTTQFSKASFSHLPAGINFEGASLNLPISFPLSDDAVSGALSVPRISWQKKDLGHLSGEIKIDRQAVRLSLDFVSKLFPGLTASSTLVSDMTENREREPQISVTVPPCKLTDFSFRKISPTLKTDALFSGIISGSGNIKLGSKQDGQFDLSLSEATLQIPEKKITITGMNTEINFPELPIPHSSPAQTFRFASGKFKDLHIKDGMVNYTIESPDSLLVEEADFDWAEGSIHTYALRLKKGTPLPRIILYCNKLRLTSILAQLGIEQVSGDGTVNGRIPVTVSDGKVTFEESFLYSTPGEGGLVQIGAADFLTAAIPRNAPQFSQLDFAQEALRDFSYGWAKLNLITEGEDLILQLKLDGKPEHPLPFSYDGKTGSFHRIEKISGQGMTRPIRLDVNFRFPLNSFLDYDKSVKDLMEYIQ
ncbi:MAG: YdbH domain-containing protein [Desulfobulbaceae bacterium]|nr:YdbH domain-containing protein [Desulfobulbaceae bacterium]